MTVPLGILKKNIIQFTPSLPQKKIEAINKLEMGVLDKIALKFDNIFWPKEAQVLSWIAKEYRNISWFINYASFSNEPVLVASVAGDLALKLEQLDDKALVERAMDTLRYLYGKNIPNPTDYIITRWGQDPFTYGSYSYIPVGASGADYDVLAQSVQNKLYFAGEATIKEFPGTVHGAYWSGIREAEKIIQLFVS